MSHNLPLYMCGACGMRQFVKPKVRSDQRYLGYRYMYLKDLDPLLKFSIQQKQDFDTWSELTKALSSVYASVHLESNGLFTSTLKLSMLWKSMGQGWKKCTYVGVVGL